MQHLLGGTRAAGVRFNGRTVTALDELVAEYLHRADPASTATVSDAKGTCWWTWAGQRGEGIENSAK